MTPKAPILNRAIVLRLEMPVAHLSSRIEDENELSLLLRWMNQILDWTMIRLGEELELSSAGLLIARTVNGLTSLKTMEKIHALIWTQLRSRIPLHELQCLSLGPATDRASAWREIAIRIQARAMGE